MKWDGETRKKFLQAEQDKLKSIIGEKRAKKFVNENNYNFTVVGMAIFFQKIIRYSKKHSVIAIIGLILAILLIIYFLYDRYFLY